MNTVTVPAISQAMASSDVYDWNNAQVPSWHGDRSVQVVDETLRDGLQNATAIDPPIEDKLALLDFMAEVGVDVVSVGLPVASQRSRDQGRDMVNHIADQKLNLIPTAAGRTVAGDVQAIADMVQLTGHPIEVYAFIGSSPIRHYAEGWDHDFLVRNITAAARVARLAGIPFCLVTEDTTRAHPATLEIVFKAALAEGAARLCLCDTVGHATPDGVARLSRFTRDLLRSEGRDEVGLDWHAHNDRGLALQTALWASELGIDRVHGTALGIGERVGNVATELLLVNLGLMNSKPTPPMDRLEAYCKRTASALGIGAIPDVHPLFGRNRSRLAPIDGPTNHSAEAVTPRPKAVASPSPKSASPKLAVSGRALTVLQPVTLRINGDRVDRAVDPGRTLLEFLRYDLDLIGTKQGCDKGDCGACTVRINGEPRLSCLTLALDCQGTDVQTVEAMPGAETLHPLLDAFDRTGAAQCGFCTPGFLMTAWALLDENPKPTRDEINIAISCNLCRCTGYGPIVDAVELAGAMLRGEEPRLLGLTDTAALPRPIDDPKIGT